MVYKVSLVVFFAAYALSGITQFNFGLIAAIAAAVAAVALVVE